MVHRFGVLSLTGTKLMMLDHLFVVFDRCDVQNTILSRAYYELLVIRELA